MRSGDESTCAIRRTTQHDQMIPENYKHPIWADAYRVHDWRNYISKKLRTMWETFTDEQKQAIAENADDQAGIEEWD